MAEWRFEAIGTVWVIDTDTPLLEASQARVTGVIDAFDREWSRFRTDSVVSSLAEHPRLIPAPEDADAMLSLYAELSDATDGAVNPLVGDSLIALGYDATYSLQAQAPVVSVADWQERVRWSADTLELTAPVMLDVGALGKGRLVDKVLAALRELPGDVTVDAGGDIAHRGEPLRIALEHPYDPARAIGVATVQDGAICASAINRRAWGEGLHHVLDARTGLPVQRWAATWALAPDAMTADAVSTALFFDGGPEVAARWGVPWVRMSTDGRAEHSGSGRVELFTA